MNWTVSDGNGVDRTGMERNSFMHDASTSRYPFDYDTLTYGSYISTEEIERASGVSRESKYFSLAVEEIKRQITRELFLRTGITHTAKQDKEAIRILPPCEASPYNSQQFAIGVRRATVAHYRNMHVDVSLLTEEQVKEHERRIELDGKILSAIQQARKRPVIAPTKRTVPASIGTLQPPAQAS